MMPLLPFVAGLVAGAAAIAAMRSERVRSAFAEAGEDLRTAAGAADDRVRSTLQAGLAKLQRCAPAAPVTEPAAPEATGPAGEEAKPQEETADPTVAESESRQEPASPVAATPLPVQKAAPVRAKARRSPRTPKSSQEGA